MNFEETMAKSALPINVSLCIRQEIQRFESVHPSIYAIYDLAEQIADPEVREQIREHMIVIEGKSELVRRLNVAVLMAVLA